MRPATTRAASIRCTDRESRGRCRSSRWSRWLCTGSTGTRSGACPASTLASRSSRGSTSRWTPPRRTRSPRANRSTTRRRRSRHAFWPAPSCSPASRGSLPPWREGCGSTGTRRSTPSPTRAPSRERPCGSERAPSAARPRDWSPTTGTPRLFWSTASRLSAMASSSRSERGARLHPAGSASRSLSSRCGASCCSWSWTGMACGPTSPAASPAHTSPVTAVAGSAARRIAPASTRQ